jgi:hypothetical protein
MSAASSAASHVRRPAPPQSARQPVHSASRFEDSPSNGEDVIRLNLADIPRVQETMDVEGFKPSLLSRLFDLVAPLHKR